MSTKNILHFYLILVLSLFSNGIILDLSFWVHLHCQGIRRLLLSAHLQRKLGHVDFWESSSISEILVKAQMEENIPKSFGIIKVLSFCPGLATDGVTSIARGTQPFLCP